jgi:uncharacterized protein (DUF58 family)
MRLTLGWVLTVAGAILGPVPVLPGAVLLIPGIAILCAESRWVRTLLRRYHQQHLMKRALREAERLGIKINLDHDPEVDGRRSASPGPPTGKGV